MIVLNNTVLKKAVFVALLLAGVSNFLWASLIAEPIENNNDFLLRLNNFEAKYGDLNSAGNIDDNWYWEEVRSLEQYAIKNKLSDEIVVRIKHLLLRPHIKKQDDVAIIQSVKELLLFPSYVQHPFSIYGVGQLKGAYERREQFVDLIEILPLYYQLGNKFTPEDFGVKRKLEGETAIFYYKIYNYESALENYLINHTHFVRLGLPYAIGSNLNNVALCYDNLGNFKAANSTYIQSITILDSLILNKDTTETNIPYLRHFRNVVRANRALLIYRNGEKINLEPILSKQLATARLKGEKHIELSSYYHLSKYYFDLNKYELANSYLDTVFSILEYHNSSKTRSASFLLRAKIYNRLNNQEKAEFWLNRYAEVSDSIALNRVRKQHLNAALKYQFDKKEEELSVFRITLENEQKIKRNQQIALFIIGSLLLAGMILLYLLNYTRKQTKAEANRKEIALEENKILLKEVHHRVKNNLQVVSGLMQLQSSKLNNPKVKEMIVDSQRYIESMSLVHQFLYQQDNLGEVSVQKYFEKLGNGLLNSWPNHHIVFDVEGENIMLHIDKMTPLGLITTELITNSYKHAFEDGKGTISIQVIRQPDHRLQYVFKDTGVGLNMEVDLAKNSLGLNLVQMLAEEMDAEISMDGENGVSVQLVFSS